MQKGKQLLQKNPDLHLHSILMFLKVHCALVKLKYLLLVVQITQFSLYFKPIECTIGRSFYLCTWIYLNFEPRTPWLKRAPIRSYLYRGKRLQHLPLSHTIKDEKKRFWKKNSFHCSYVTAHQATVWWKEKHSTHWKLHDGQNMMDRTFSADKRSNDCTQREWLPDWLQPTVIHFNQEQTMTEMTRWISWLSTGY